MKNITIKQLRAFITVARERSFTRAASRLNLSQSALTIAVRQLESEIDLKLFDRTTRAVHLTSHAAIFLPVAERLLEDLSRSLDDLSAIADRQKGNVVAAASASYLCCILVPTVAALRERFPGIHVRLLNTPDNLTRRVLEEEIDFGVTNVWQPVHGLEAFPLLEDAFGLVCQTGHPLAARPGRLGWSDLRGAKLVAMLGGTHTREILDRSPRIRRLLEPPVCEANSIFALGAMIGQNMGAATLPALVSRAIVSDALIYRPLYEPVLKRELFVIKRQGRSLSPAAIEVLRFMLDELARIDSPHIHIRTDKASFMDNLAAR